MKTYVILGGTGKTGKSLGLKLLESGNKVRIVCREAEKAEELKQKGGDIFIGDNLDENFLKGVFSGADAAYVLLPIDLQAEDYTATQVAHATAIRNAIVSQGIKYAVTLSSVGAHLDKGTGVVLGLHKMEALFNAVPNINVRHLRATYFMENTLTQIHSIKNNGFMAGPENGEIKFAIIAARDIIAAAFKNLTSLDFEGKSVEYVLGQRDLSYNEIAEVYGQALEISNLKYLQISEDDFISGMTQTGVSPSAAGKLYDFTKLINQGEVSSFYTRNHENTTPTSIEEFAGVFKRIYEAQ
ncbi:NmrA family NAD(P)-binding protein [Galbibacter sp.]|uniref:NmrA family NAD(P)-binding protein n=1 Tax=Galbibacter sp. TaxID=2918471 RepID=UPI003A8FDFBC